MIMRAERETTYPSQAEELARRVLLGTAEMLTKIEMQVESDSVVVSVYKTAMDPHKIIVIERKPRTLPCVEELRIRFNLTKREAEVALLLCERRSGKEIARI